MKYIKRFNEELNPGTYRRAGYGLKGSNKEVRGNNLIDYADEKEYGLYNIKCALGSGGSNRVYFADLEFTAPRVVFRSMDPDLMVKGWEEGNNELEVFFDVYFKKTNKIPNIDASIDGVRISDLLVAARGKEFLLFTFRLQLTFSNDGLDFWYEDQCGYLDEDDNWIDNDEVTDKTKDIYSFYSDIKYNFMKLVKIPEVELIKSVNGKKILASIFADRKSALKFKRLAPSLFTEHIGKIMDILTIVDASGEDVEELKNDFNNISINPLYDDSTNVSDYKKWYNNKDLFQHSVKYVKPQSKQLPNKQLSLFDESHIIRFNEELRPSTYRSAAVKLRNLGGFNVKRADELDKWAIKRSIDDNKIADLDEIHKWKENIEKLAPFGKVKLLIKNKEDNKEMSGDFYPEFIPDRDMIIESLNESGGESGTIFFSVGIIPVDDETNNKCIDVMPDPEMSNGFYWGLFISIYYYIEDGKVIFGGININSYDDSLSGEIEIANRASSNTFKRIFSNIFLDSLDGGSGHLLDSGYNDSPNLYQELENTLLANMGLSVDYGLELKDISDYVKSYPANKFIIE